MTPASLRKIQKPTVQKVLDSALQIFRPSHLSCEYLACFQTQSKYCLRPFVLRPRDQYESA